MYRFITDEHRVFRSWVTSFKTWITSAKIINKEQELKIGSLIQVNNKLSTENKNLQNQLNKLHDKLNINSSNSGLPSSKDVYRIEKKSKVSSGKKAGGQPGHKHNGYQFKIADKIVNVIPQRRSCDCGGQLVLSERFQAHQKIEIPPIKPFVTEYRLHCASCAVCAKQYKTSLDDYKLLEKNAESIITSLGGFFNNSKRDIQSILSQIFNLDISLGLISTSEARVSYKLESKYNELVEMAENSSYVHLDESVANNKGNLSWCWLAANKAVTVFKLMNSRGQKSFRRIFAWIWRQSNYRQVCGV